MRITTAVQLLKHMRACFPRDAYSPSSRKSFARIVVGSENTFHNPATGFLDPCPDTPQWVLRAIATKAKQSSGERRRVNDGWLRYFRTKQGVTA
jgi:hypothetical protein